MLLDSLPVVTLIPVAGDVLAPDLSANRAWIVQMPAGNITIANPINAQPGNHLFLVIIQDSIGARLVTWGTVFKKLLTLSVTANARDSVSYWWVGVNMNQFGSALAIA